MDVGLLMFLGQFVLPWKVVLIVAYRKQIIALFRRLRPLNRRADVAPVLDEIRADMAAIRKDVQGNGTRLTEQGRKLDGLQHALGLAITEAVDEDLDDEDLDGGEANSLGPDLIAPRRSRGGFGRRI